MGYLIRMAPEVEEWLAAVRDRDPAAADLIDEAVAALQGLAERAWGRRSWSRSVMIHPSARGRIWRSSYQRQLEMLTRVRRAVAERGHVAQAAGTAG